MTDGITTSSFIDGQNINLAIPINDINMLLNNMGNYTLQDIIEKHKINTITYFDGSLSQTKIGGIQ